jgi:hypothetical protein
LLYAKYLSHYEKLLILMEIDASTLTTPLTKLVPSTGEFSRIAFLSLAVLLVSFPRDVQRHAISWFVLNPNCLWNVVGVGIGGGFELYERRSKWEVCKLLNRG